MNGRIQGFGQITSSHKPQLATDTEDSVIDIKQLPKNMVRDFFVLIFIFTYSSSRTIELRPNNLCANRKKLQLTTPYSAAGNISYSQTETQSD
jgi:hypothetical protein